MILGQDNFAGEKVFECFRLLTICGQAILQAKKTLNSSRLLMIRGPDNFAGETIFEYFRLLMICGRDNFAAAKDFESFQVFDDLRPRQFCRWKNLWLFPGCWWSASKRTLQAKKCWNIPGCWWFAAKIILQVKKSLITFGVLMICSQDYSAGEKVSESFRDIDDLRPRQFCRRKKSLNFSRLLMICV